MLIQCPNCKRTADIPDRYRSAPHNLRCRACDTRFLTTPVPGKEETERPAMPVKKSSETRIASGRAPAADLAVSTTLDDDDSALDALGPEDSHYELTGINDDENDDSQVELPAFASDDAPSSDEIAVLSEDAPSEEIVIAHPRHFNLIDSLGRYRFAFSLTVGVLSLTSLGFFVREGILNAQTIQSSIAALLAGCVGLCGLLLLLFSMTRSPPHVLVGELAKYLRRPSPRTDMDS